MTEEEFEIDPATGLPVLPEEDLFYRVEYDVVRIMRRLPDYDGRDRLYRPSGDWHQYKKWVGLKRVKMVRGTNLVEPVSSVLNLPSKRVTKEEILPLAKRALRNYLERQEFEALLGDYPPKRLDGEEQ